MGPLGILMLDTAFPRPVGDIGNAASFPFPVLYRTIPSASAEGAVRGDAEIYFDGFLAGAEALIAEGAVVISTSCGFLSVFQDRLTSALPVPVVTSSLTAFRRIQNTLPSGQNVGILTIDRDALSPRHLAAAGVSEDAAITGMPPDGPLSRMIFADYDPAGSRAELEAEMVAAGRALAAAEPALGAVLLECTNMGPYADALRAALKVPVIGIVDILTEAMRDV